MRVNCNRRYGRGARPRSLLGDVVEVYGFASSDVWKLGLSEDNGCAILRGANGKYATLQATWTEWKGYRFYVEAYGSRGMARAYYAPMMSMAVFMDKTGGTRRRKFNLYPEIVLQEKIFGWQLTTEKAFRQEFADFVKLCGGEQGTIADGFSGFRAVEIANAVYRSARERQPIQLAPPF
ncbi:MAG: Gfo/Idh/MocA family oxidoreductase [Blastocatellia bacterium]